MLTPRTRRLLQECGVFLAAFAFSVGGNLLFESAREVALQNSRDLVALQDALGMSIESRVQDALEAVPAFMDFLVLFYAGPHFMLTFGFLAWLWTRRHDSFSYVRNAFLIFTLSAFTFQWVFPVAPPRMMPELGFTDSVTSTLPLNSETPWIKTLVNDVGALPSVHTGWAILVAVFCIRLTSHPARWLWLLYPATIVVSIVATANHFVWDIVLCLAWLMLAEAVHGYLAVRHGFPSLRPHAAAARVPMGS